MAIRTAKPVGSKTAGPQMAPTPFKPDGRAAGSKPSSAAMPNAVLGISAPTLTADKRQTMIAEAAYYLAEQRGFAEGHDLEDWLLAEKQIDSGLHA